MNDLREEAAYISWLQEQLSDAESYSEDAVGLDRETAFSFYLRRPMGDERPGRSQVQSGDVYKVVEGISTAIADIYCSTADAVTFSPRGPDDEAKATQRTEAVMYTFWTTCKGYLPMLEAIKSGVQLKTGYLMWYWAPQKRLTRERYKGLTQEAMALLADNDAIRDVRQTGIAPDGSIDVEVDIIKDQGRIVVESVPPENVHVVSSAKSADTQRAPGVFVDHFKTEAECLECGYTSDQIEAMDFGGAGWNDHLDRDRVRNIALQGQARITTGYVVVDRDGDGVVELRKSVFSGEVLLSDEIIDEINIAGWTPNIQPHEYYGRAPADDAVQVQKLNTTLWRQGLDSLYHATSPMWRVSTDASRVNIADFYSPQIGQPVRAEQGSAEPIVLPYVGQHVFPAIEQSTADGENLTGWTRYSQGMDADSLNNTATGVKIITNMSQQRVRMMARNFGEMCFAPCLRGVSKLLSQHGSKALSLRIAGQYVEVDPREWAEEFDMTVNVGLGTVDKEQQAGLLQGVAQAQALAVQGGGLGKLVTVKNLYNVQSRLAQVAGIKDPAFAWTDPDTVPEQPQVPQIPPEVQKEQIRIQADGQKFQSQAQLDREKAAQELADKQAQRAHDAQLALQIESLKQEAETQRALQVETLRLQHQAILSAEKDAAKMEHDGARAAVGDVSSIAPALTNALEMMAAGMTAMQQVAAILAAPKQMRVVKNKDGTFSGAVEPIIQ